MGRKPYKHPHLPPRLRARVRAKGRESAWILRNRFRGNRDRTCDPVAAGLATSAEADRKLPDLPFVG